MSYLTAARRYDVLRVSLSDGPSYSSVLSRMQEEFLDLLSSTPGCRTVIVELRAVRHLGSDLVGLLQTCRRLTEQSGRRFRLNGVSQMVSRALSLLDQSASPFEGPAENGAARRGRPLARREYQLDV